MTNKLKLTYHQDAGHGWLAVKRKVAEELDIIKDITPYSYQKGKTIYLEEDLDAQTFMKKAREKNIEIEMKSSYRSYSPIRSYEQFRA